MNLLIYYSNLLIQNYDVMLLKTHEEIKKLVLDHLFTRKCG